MLHYLKLIRIPNLLMVPFTMYLLLYGIIEPALDYVYSPAVGFRISPVLPSHIFNLVILINMCLGAAGYVINDYFDRKIDSINRPNEVIVGNKIHRRSAIFIHWVFNGLAILMAAYVSYYFKKPGILVAYLLIAGIFWLYSTTYKKQLLLGNIIVALGTAMIPIQVAYFQLVPLNQSYGVLLAEQGFSFVNLLIWMAAFAFFAFLINLIREIIKDLEDFEGDNSYGCNTMPIAWGINASKVVVSILSTITAGILIYIFYRFLGDSISKWYLGILVVAPLLSISVLIFKANSSSYYRKLSWLTKGILLTGICYALVARYVLLFNFNI